MSFTETDASSPEEVTEEAQKYIHLTKIFFCKVIECIYSHRCPKELSDLANDENPWFGMEIPKSESLRQLAAKRTEYGWFQIDVILTDPDVIIERWVLSHEPIDMSHSVPLLGSNRTELRRHTFRRFSQLLRSVFSLLNALPCQTLQFAMEQLVAPSRRITAICSHFMSLPVKSEPLSGITVEIGPVITPLGKCCITCSSVKEVSELIPKIMSNTRTSTLFSLDKPICETDDSSWVNAPLQEESDSENSSDFLKKSWQDELKSQPEELMTTTESNEIITADEFFAKLESLNLHFESDRTMDETKQAFKALAREVDALSEDWLCTSG